LTDKKNKNNAGEGKTSPSEKKESRVEFEGRGSEGSCLFKKGEWPNSPPPPKKKKDLLLPPRRERRTGKQADG